MKYRSRLRVEAWQVDFSENPLPDWVQKEKEAQRIVKKGWPDGVMWLDVYCADEDVFAYALAGTWIVLEPSGNLRCLSNDTFSLLFEPDL